MNDKPTTKSAVLSSHGTDTRYGKINECTGGYKVARFGGLPVRRRSNFIPAYLKKIWRVNIYPFFYEYFSRCLDVAASLFGLAVFSPAILIISILVKLDSPGPVFYKQKRVFINRRKSSGGVSSISERRHYDLSGQPFNIYKIRTMHLNAETETGAVWAKESDSRITRIGRFLRLTRFDEIPQFINILKNEMKLIGPRPERPEFVADLKNEISGFCKRHFVKPGITGLAQIKYRYSASVSDARRKSKYDLLYLKKRSVAMDLFILLKTLPTVIFGRGAR